MILKEVGKALRSRLRSKALWGAFFFVVAAGQPILIHDYASFPFLYIAWQELAYSIIYFAFIWIAPLPFEWNGKRGRAPLSLRALVQGFVLSELLMASVAWLDLLVGRWVLHQQVGNGVSEYLSMMSTFGPFLFLEGIVLSRNQKLEVEVVEMHGQMQEAQTKHLQGQLHPHVLFNALNSLAELVLESPQEAYNCVRSMAGFLRRVLDASEIHNYPLSEERALLLDYLTMEAQRFGSRLQVEWEWDHTLDSLPVTPLLLQPLVENALKHGISKLRKGGTLLVSARREGDLLHLAVANQGPECPDPGQSRGIGVKNLRNRLALAYGTQGAFELVREGDWTVAHISLSIPFLESHSGDLEPCIGG